MATSMWERIDSYEATMQKSPEFAVYQEQFRIVATKLVRTQSQKDGNLIFGTVNLVAFRVQGEANRSLEADTPMEIFQSETDLGLAGLLVCAKLLESSRRRIAKLFDIPDPWAGMFVARYWNQIVIELGGSLPPTLDRNQATKLFPH